MNDKKQQKDRAHNFAKASLFLGIGSLVVLLASIIIGLLFESIGIVSFFGFVSVLSLSAIVSGFMAKNQIAKENLADLSKAKFGIVLGFVAIAITIVLRIAVFLFFIPWLGA